MSEQILERQATSEPSAVPGMASLDVEDSARNRNLVVVALAIVAGLVIGGVAIFVMRPAAEEVAAETTLAVAAAAAAQAAAEEQAEAIAAAEQATPKKTKVKLTSRDPFAPLIPKQPEPAPAAAPAVDAGSDASANSSAATSASGVTITALTVSTKGDSVTLKLDGTKYAVDVGETFAKNYRLYDIFNDNCAGFLYGDQNAVVCEGDSVTLA